MKNLIDNDYILCAKCETDPCECKQEWKKDIKEDYNNYYKHWENRQEWKNTLNKLPQYEAINTGVPCFAVDDVEQSFQRIFSQQKKEIIKKLYSLRREIVDNFNSKINNIK